MTPTASASKAPKPTEKFGIWHGHEPEPTVLTGVGLGPGVIGQKQYEFNQRHAPQAKAENGPMLSMTPEEWEFYEADGKPENWMQWLDTMRAPGKPAA